MSLHSDIVGAALVLPRFLSAAKSVVERLSFQRIVAVICLVTGDSDGPVGVVIIESGLTLRLQVVEIADDLRSAIQRIVEKAGEHDSVCILRIHWSPQVVIEL